jgi:hypothetical protein
MRYQDFHIRIEPDAKGGFETQVLTSSYGTATRTPFELSFSEPQLKMLPQALERLRDSRRRIKEVSGLTVEKIGDGLFRSLFAGEIGIKFYECLSNIEGNPEAQGLRILLEFDLRNPRLAALAALPWELLWNAKRDDFLTRLSNTSVARFLPADRPPLLSRIGSPLKVLVVMSRPLNLPALDLTKEWTGIWGAAHDEIQLTAMHNPTRKQLRAKLLRETWHVLHFMGHGGLDRDGEGVIYLENPEGNAEVVTARDLADIVKGSHDLRLVFLNACRTGVINRNGRNPFTGTATALTLAGAPAVIAMQASIYDQPAIELSANFYLHIAARKPVDTALAEARLSLERAVLDWAMPVLFTRVANGRILGEEEVPVVNGAPAGPPEEEKGLDPMGPVFLSYRASDGRALATDLAWALRSTGVPVWHDTTDLPPGDTPTRLQEALAAGLSGALLLITPDLDKSQAVREIELPDILRLSQLPAFTFAVASVVETTAGTGNLDYTAPDRLLGTPGTLATCKQYSVSAAEDLATLARDMVLRRMKAHRQLGQDCLVLDLQTRFAPQADVSKAGLVVRTVPPPKGKRAPAPTIWQPFQAFLSALPQLLETSGAQNLLVRGGAHLTVAFSLGAALPSTSRWPLSIESPPGEVWSSGAEGSSPALVEDTQTFAATGKPVAVLVDLVPTPQPVDGFKDHLKAHPLEYSAAIRISAAEPRPLKPNEGAATAVEAARRIREATHSFDTHQVHLFLRTSFPMAVLLGRQLNTLETTLYEWEDGESSFGARRGSDSRHPRHSLSGGSCHSLKPRRANLE